jgi:hypothetical protein
MKAEVSMKNPEAVVQDIESLVKRYNIWATQLQALTVLLTILAIVSSIMIGFFAGELSDVYIKVLAGVAAISTSLLTGLRLTKKAQDIRDAYRYLQHALYLYKATDSYTIENLIASYEAAEKTVGHVEVEDTPTLAEFTKKNSM